MCTGAPAGGSDPQQPQAKPHAPLAPAASRLSHERTISFSTSDPTIPDGVHASSSFAQRTSSLAQRCCCLFSDGEAPFDDRHHTVYDLSSTHPLLRHAACCADGNNAPHLSASHPAYALISYIAAA